MNYKNWTVKDILALTYLKGLNLSNIAHIVNNHNSLSTFLNQKDSLSKYPRLLQGSLFNEEIKSSLELAEKQIELCEKCSVSIITMWDEIYPALLKETIAAPVVLFVKGKLQPAESVSISVVGTRNSTVYGKLTAEKYAEFIAANNVITTSGMAYGIDSYAHTSAIKNKGITYAVIASGIDSIGNGTSSQLNIANKILDSGGAVISEYKCGVKAIRPFFHQRNRIISGISLATIVIESGEKGGALITARFASDQQREVFAVPGPINSFKSVGTNKLIKSNLASITLAPDDVFTSLGLKLSAYSDTKSKEAELFPSNEKIVYENINYEPVQIDELCDKTGLDMSELLVCLLNIEFKGLIRQLPGKYYVRH